MQLAATTRRLAACLTFTQRIVALATRTPFASRCPFVSRSPLASRGSSERIASLAARSSLMIAALPAALLLLAIAVTPTLAQQHVWSDQFSLPTVNGWARCLVEYNGDLIAGGSFDFAGQCEAHNIVRWDGAWWSPLGAGVDGEVLALTVYDGRVVAGGRFQTAGGAPADHVAVWDGSQWSPLGCGFNDAVYDFVCYRGGLVAAGCFTAEGRYPIARLAFWDGQMWRPLANGIDGCVYAVTAFQGDLVAGGDFTTIGGRPASSIARWDGANWNALGSGILTYVPYHCGRESHTRQGMVFDLVASSDLLFAGGYFNVVDGVSPQSVAAWDGHSWRAVAPPRWSSPPPEPSGQVFALALHDGQLFAAGGFLFLEDAHVRSIARADDSGWADLEGGLVWRDSGVGLSDPYPGTGYALADFRGDLVVAGDFRRAGPRGSGSIARWMGAAWTPLGSGGAGVNAPVSRLRSVGKGLIALGPFDQAGGVPVVGAARLSGETWLRCAGDSVVLDDVVIHNGRPHATGRFFKDGTWRAGVARWDGNVWTMIGRTIFPPTHLLSHGGSLYVGGNFESIDNLPANNVAQWDGHRWNALGGGRRGLVQALDAYGGRVVVGCSYGPGDGRSIDLVSAWDGIHWITLGADETRRPESVEALTVYNGRLMAGGSFGAIGGCPAAGIAQFDGTRWQPLGSGVDSMVTSLVVHDGALVAGGKFLNAGGLPAPHLAIWNGRQWDALNSGCDGDVLALAEHGGALYVGGGFTRMGGVASYHIARLGETNGALREPGLTELTADQGASRVTAAGSAGAGFGPSRILDAGPNPFNSAMHVHVVTWSGSGTRLRVFNLAGELVRTFDLDGSAVGPRGVLWDGRDGAGAAVASGVYILRLDAGDAIDSRRVTLVK
jgi:hypothetical protein